MSCRRICRELLWLTRFGEIGVDSAPHLEHLSGCRACRDEVGFDRAMVQRLREALLARVAETDPSPTTWERIVARAQAPEPPRVRLWEWSTTLVARLRVATAMAFTGLALILTLNTQLVPVGGQSTDAPAESALIEDGRTAAGLGRDAPARSSGAAVQDRRPAYGPPQRVEPTLPPAIGSQLTTAPAQAAPAREEEPADSFVLVFELIEEPEPAPPPAEEESASQPEPTLAGREPGEPS